MNQKYPNQRLNKTVTTKSFLKLPEGTQLWLMESEIKRNKKLATDEAIKKFKRLAVAAGESQINMFQRKTASQIRTGFQPPTEGLTILEENRGQ